MKKKDRQNKILEYLLRKKKTTWTDIQTDVKIPPKELSQDLKEMLDAVPPKIKCWKDTKDRRRTWYSPIVNKAKTETKRYYAVQHIETLKNPISAEISFPLKGGKTIAHTSVFADGAGYNPEKEQKALEKMMMLYHKSAQDTNMDFHPEFFNKVIFFFMIERKER